ncbi:MAG: hypothetical protein WC913_00740 [Desulfuromonas sp.]
MKQAVVVIHGIGEQVPMATLRNLVSSVLDKRKNPLYPKFHNKPDHMSAGYEQRLLRSLREGRRPTTDFYEFYWAHHMRDSKLSQVYYWIARLVLRFPWHVPKALLPAYSALWIGTIVILSFFVSGLMGADYSDSILSGLLKQKALYISFVLAAFQTVYSYFMLGYVADAARYLMPSPGNIEQRNKIRHEGLELLRKLHGLNKYSRIIIVGHSLGSVIGYDLIRLLWDDFRTPQGTGHVVNKELENFEQKHTDIFSKENKDTPGAKVQRFQERQYALWRELRTPELNTPWLITDFITLGSPMAHGIMLMAKNEADFKERVEEFEFPTCPPNANPDGLYYPKNIEILKDNQKIKVSRMIPHHGAPFACTRWANIYFKYKYWIFGDLIGGKLGNSFGEGIKDIQVKPSLSKKEPKTIRNYLAYVLCITLCSHTCYWRKFPAGRFTNFINDTFFKSAKKESLRALKSEMHL